MNTLISIIIPSYNKQNYISETILSVINQTYANWELIIVDDLSNDNTVDVVKSYQKSCDKLQLFVNPENKGANYSRNFGIKEAKGEYIVFLDADDLLAPDCLQNRIRHIESTNFDFCVFTLEIFKDKVGDIKQFWKPYTKQPLVDFLTHNLPWQTMQPIWKKKFLIHIGGFNENYMRLQDVEIHTRALFQKNVNYKLVNDLPDCFFRIDETRKNFNNSDFLNRWVNSVLFYYKDFYYSAKELGLQRKLLGTIYQTYLQLLYYRKTDRINKNDFTELKNKLFNSSIRGDLRFKSKLAFLITGYYNLLPFRIPGINYLLSKLVIF